MTPTGTPSERAVRAWLAALLEAIDLPHGATVGDGAARLQALGDRAMYAAIALRNLLREGDPRPLLERLDDEADYLRARLADLPPLTYETWKDAQS
jgi:hypothetical protein